jgi:hypothetical protein
MVSTYPAPAGTFKKWYVPVEFVVWVNFRPVALFVSVITAPGIAAPVASVTTPVMDDESWALRAEGARRIPAKSAKTIATWSLEKRKECIKLPPIQT